MLKVGTPWTDQASLHQALKCPHPLLTASTATADDCLKAMLNVMTRGPEAISRKRREFLSMLEAWVVELKAKEVAIKEAMRNDANMIMAKKQISLVSRLD